MSKNVIEVWGLRKVYGTFTAVDGISFKVKQGQIYGLLGPNGAGKTSTLECLEGLRQVDGGSLKVMGIDPSRGGRALSRVLGVQLQTSGLPPTMTPREAMAFFCAYHGVSPRMDLLEHLGLIENQHVQYARLSTGQQRRLALAVSIAHQPPVVILDEPTAGLDVGSRVALHELMTNLRDGGTSILLATHDMAEAEKMADRIAIMMRGRIVSEGTPQEITAAGSTLTRVSVRTEQGILKENETDFPSVHQRKIQEEYVVYYVTDPGVAVSALIRHINAEGDELIDLRVERPSLEERFLEITEGRGPA